MAIHILQTQSFGNAYLTAYQVNDHDYFYIACDNKSDLLFYGECLITSDGSYLPVRQLEPNAANPYAKSIDIFYPNRSSHIIDSVDYQGRVTDFQIGGGLLRSREDNQLVMLESQRWFQHRIANTIKHICAKEPNGLNALLAANLIFNNANELHLKRIDRVVLHLLGNQYKHLAINTDYYCDISYELYLKLNTLIAML